jgi:Domain of unknown function (DUF1735)
LNGQTIIFAKNIMRFLKPLFAIFALLTVFSACKKDSANVDFTPSFYFLSGDTTYFDDNLILFNSSDTITYDIIISSSYLLSKEVTVTIGTADNYRTFYNTSKGTDYKAMPSAAYSFQTVITAGINSVYDTIPVKINKKFLSSDDYMLPINITSVSSYTIDSAASVIYLHTSGNKLAGIYASTGEKIMYIGDSADNNINSTDTFTLFKNLIPLGADSSQLDYADLGGNGWEYIVGFSHEDGSFFAKANDIILNSVQKDSFKVITATYNASTSAIYIKSSYKNSSGDQRIVEESLTLQ